MIYALAATPAAAVQGADARSSATSTPRQTPAKPSTSDTPAAKSQTKGEKAPAQEVTVTANSQADRSSIDRKSYSLSKDLQGATGSLADVLRNIPSVEVGVQGELSLRGDANVTVLVDGKPSALFSGSSRADALQQLPASQYERVEVMTNPSAAFKPDGTAGIINLITRKGRAAGRTGTVKANLGTGDRYNASLSGGYTGGKLTLSANASVRHDENRFEGSTRQELPDPSTGQLTQTDASFDTRSRSTSGYGSVNLDYDLDAKTRVSASASTFGADYRSPGTNRYRSAASTGPLAQDYDASGDSSGHFVGGSGSLDLTRRFPGDQHELSVHLSYDDNRNDYGATQVFTYSRPAGTSLFLDNRQISDQASAELKVEYKRPLPHEAKLVAGYELDVDDGDFDQRGRLGTREADAVATPGLNNLFDATQAVHAFYATYERTFGRLTVLPGLRLEEAVIDTDQKTSKLEDSWSYFDAYPTLHLQYKLDSVRKLSASFSRRVQRPGLQSLNPYLIYNGPLNYSQGDARLRPSVTESYELGFEQRKKQTTYQATFFFRNNHDLPVEVTRDLGGGVLLATQANLGSSRSGGLELVTSGKLAKTLSYNASATVAFNVIDASNLGFAAGRSDVSSRGRVSLNWEPTKTDLAQVNVSASGEQLTAQGYREGSVFLTAGYRRKFTDKLSGVLTANDPFGWASSTTVIDTPLLKQRTHYSFHRQALYVGLIYALGGADRRRPDAFDFGGGGAGGGAPTP